MEIKMYLQMLQKGWWLIVLCALAALFASLTYSFFSEPIYRATARFVASPDASFTQGGDIINSINTLDKRSIVTTYSIVLESDTIFSQALQNLDISSDIGENYDRSVVVLPESNVLEIYVDGADPTIASLFANEIGKQAISYIDGLNQGFTIRLLDAAQVNPEPIYPRPTRDALLAVIFGLVLGVSLSIIREQMLAPIESFLRRNTLDQDSGVYTRQYFDQKLDETLERSAFVGLHSMGLIHLEGFAELINAIPTPLKQQVLRQVTKIVQNELRGSDMVGRWDDATFAVLLAGTPGEAAIGTLGRVQTALSAPFFLGDQEEVYLKPRIGLVEHMGNSSSAFRDNAIEALRKSVSGKINLFFYKPDQKDVKP